MADLHQKDYLLKKEMQDAGIISKFILEKRIELNKIYFKDLLNKYLYSNPV